MSHRYLYDQLDRRPQFVLLETEPSAEHLSERLGTFESPVSRHIRSYRKKEYAYLQLGTGIRRTVAHVRKQTSRLYIKFDNLIQEEINSF